MENVFLRIEGLTKNFGNFTALRDISLEVFEGEFVCFLGPSGCGKTTLLRAIAGLDIQTRGRIEQAGRDIENAGAAKVLLDLLEKIETTGAEGAGQSPQTQSSGPGIQTNAAPQSPTTSGAVKTKVLKRIEETSVEEAPKNAETGSTGVNLDSPPARKEDDDTQTIQNVGSAAPAR